jgi:hypothetical protein
VEEENEDDVEGCEEEDEEEWKEEEVEWKEEDEKAVGAMYLFGRAAAFACPQINKCYPTKKNVLTLKKKEMHLHVRRQKIIKNKERRKSTP